MTRHWFPLFRCFAARWWVCCSFPGCFLSVAVSVHWVGLSDSVLICITCDVDTLLSVPCWKAVLVLCCRICLSFFLSSRSPRRIPLAIFDDGAMMSAFESVWSGLRLCDRDLFLVSSAMPWFAWSSASGPNGLEHSRECSSSCLAQAMSASVAARFDLLVFQMSCVIASAILEACCRYLGSCGFSA